MFDRVLVAVLFVLPFGLSIAAREDMNRRGRNGLLYGLAVLFLPGIGLAIWIVGRFGASRRPVRRTHEPPLDSAVGTAAPRTSRQA